MTEIRIGLQGGGDHKRVAELEAMDLDSLWTGGHIASRNPSTEAMVSLCRLSAWAERVQLGTAILLLPLYSPAIIAKMIADLDRYTNGRLILGIGVGGEYPQEFRATQVPITERGKRTNEMIPLIRRLWTAEEISHDGPFYPMEDVKIHPAPAQPGGVPMIISGRKEAAMKRAAVMGDGWIPYLYSSRRYAESVETIRGMAAENGRDLEGDGFTFYAYCFLNINADSDTAKLDAATAIGGNYQQDFKKMIDNVAVAGNPDEVLEKLKAFVDGGARHFVFSPMTRAEGGQEPIVKLLMEEVVRPLREYAKELP